MLAISRSTAETLIPLMALLDSLGRYQVSGVRCQARRSLLRYLKPETCHLTPELQFPPATAFARQHVECFLRAPRAGLVVRELVARRVLAPVVEDRGDDLP